MTTKIFWSVRLSRICCMSSMGVALPMNLFGHVVMNFQANPDIITIKIETRSV